jgi:DNA-directed RNA polymerase subunit RPC12/RpoP
VKDFLYRFFRGRYGAYGSDRMTRVMVVIAVILLVLSFISPLSLLYYVAFIILFYCYFRMFSKNIPARYKENEFFVKHTDKVIGFFTGIKDKFTGHKAYHIYKCPGCGQKIRIPRGKGKVAIRCPKCGREFVKRT